MREGGALRLPARLALGGVDLGYWLKARWPDDQAVLEAIAVEIREMMQHDSENLAKAIAREVLEGLDRSLS